jgi:hypothetical protein
MDGKARRWLVAAFVAVAALGATAPAQAHFSGYDSVDDCEIRDEDGTSFDAERIYARDAWEALKNTMLTGYYNWDNCVNIASDTWRTWSDLDWKDANRSDVSWAGLYENEPGADDIHLNRYYMQYYNDCTRKNVAMHELGHAHGLAHSFSGQVMYKYVSSVCTLQYEDKSDYHALWG